MVLVLKQTMETDSFSAKAMMVKVMLPVLLLLEVNWGVDDEVDWAVDVDWLA